MEPNTSSMQERAESPARLCFRAMRRDSPAPLRLRAGFATSGNSSVYLLSSSENRPNMTSASIVVMVTTGRLIAKSEINIAVGAHGNAPNNNYFYGVGALPCVPTESGVAMRPTESGVAALRRGDCNHLTFDPNAISIPQSLASTVSASGN